MPVLGLSGDVATNHAAARIPHYVLLSQKLYHLVVLTLYLATIPVTITLSVTGRRELGLY